MARVTFWVQLLLLVLILQQLDAGPSQCRGLKEEIAQLEEDVTRITAQKHQYEQNYGACKVSMCVKLFSVWRHVVIVKGLKQKNETLTRQYYVTG
jgi:hypothetical protein